MAMTSKRQARKEGPAEFSGSLLFGTFLAKLGIRFGGCGRPNRAGGAARRVCSMRGLHNAVGWRSLAIVVPVWALIAPGLCAAICGWSHCEGAAGPVGSLAESHAHTLQAHPESEHAETHSAQRLMDCEAATAESAHETAICRCDEVASLLPKAVDTGSAIALNVMVVALPAPALPAVDLPREVFDLPIHPFPNTNPPLLI